MTYVDFRREVDAARDANDSLQGSVDSQWMRFYLIGSVENHWWLHALVSLTGRKGDGDSPCILIDFMADGRYAKQIDNWDQLTSAQRASRSVRA